MVLLSALLLSSLALPQTSAAAAVPRRDTTIVIGTVRETGTQHPLDGVAVSLSDGSGTLTSADGRYRLRVIHERTTRTVSVVARRIGYAPVSRTVAVTDTLVTIDFAMTVSATSLSAVVVTGSGNGQFAGSSGATVAARPAREPGWNREQYHPIAENAFHSAQRTPLSTFAIDVDRASYANVRRFLDGGTRPPFDAVRIEELVNYFRYEYAEPPRSGDPLTVSVETHPAPWQPSHRLVRIAMQAQRLPVAELPPANLVFLIDVSGSMQSANKLPLVVASLRLLAQELRPQDRVAIVVYAGAAGLVLPSTAGSEKARIIEALDNLRAGGSTNGADGIQLAYAVAREHFVRGGANRVILATDGDFNVGVTSEGALLRLIETQRKSGVRLTVLGYGMGNLQDAMMEQLADRGDGQYAYIDDIVEADKALVREMSGTLYTLAKDVKIQVEFNPARVQSYRLVGYENRLLRDEDFNDDAKDAGELGAGHSVTALYDVVLVDSDATVSTGSVDALRYSRETRARRGASTSGELAYVKVRWQPPQGGRSVLRSWAVTDSPGDATTDFTFASAVAGFGLLLRDSPHAGTLTWSGIRRLAERGLGADIDGDRAAFVRLIGLAERATPVTASLVKDP
jgi:Ca-activated chloride channel homolog